MASRELRRCDDIPSWWHRGEGASDISFLAVVWQKDSRDAQKLREGFLMKCFLFAKHDSEQLMNGV